ncbi:RNA polymerase sigma factor [Gynurincola endophyticus]|uniref:RNA polymerase sigma factor n=1 Tax=Gynurincola endophyticus TaxID=2479004 RepID=UPI000F8CDBBB|nr:sigma-70 family RNA polymerase sigma factor [Gynurincola endophyticus]
MNYQKASDIELWHKCRQNDKKAYSELFERFFPSLYKQATFYTRNEMDAEELVMDLLLAIWEKRSLLNITVTVKGYFQRSLRNRIINYLHKNIPGTEPIELIPEEQLMSNLSTDRQLLEKEIIIAYQKQLDQLSPRRRQLFLLSREENLTHPEIAQKTGLSVNTVKNHITSAIHTLRENTEGLTTFCILLIINNS